MRIPTLRAQRDAREALDHTRPACRSIMHAKPWTTRVRTAGIGTARSDHPYYGLSDLTCFDRAQIVLNYSPSKNSA